MVHKNRLFLDETDLQSVSALVMCIILYHVLKLASSLSVPHQKTKTNHHADVVNPNEPVNEFASYILVLFVIEDNLVYEYAALCSYVILVRTSTTYLRSMYAFSHRFTPSFVYVCATGLTI